MGFPWHGFHLLDRLDHRNKFNVIRGHSPGTGTDRTRDVVVLATRTWLSCAPRWMITSEEGILCPPDFVHMVWLMSRTFITFLTVYNESRRTQLYNSLATLLDVTTVRLTAMSRAVLLSIILYGIERESTKSSCILKFTQCFYKRKQSFLRLQIIFVLSISLTRWEG
jgi:hypothetical protein